MWRRELGAPGQLLESQPGSGALLTQVLRDGEQYLTERHRLIVGPGCLMGKVSCQSSLTRNLHETVTRSIPRSRVGSGDQGGEPVEDHVAAWRELRQRGERVSTHAIRSTRRA